MRQLSIGAIPSPLQPKAVVEADGVLSRLLGELEDARLAWREAQLAVPAASCADLEDEAAALVAGEALKDPGWRERAAQAKLDELDRRITALTAAVNSATTELATAIVNEKSGWLEALEGADAKASKEFRAALQKLRASLEGLTAVRGAIEWLGRADEVYSLAESGAGAVAPELRLLEPLTDANSKPTARSLVEGLEKVVDPPEDAARLTTNRFGRTVYAQSVGR